MFQPTLTWTTAEEPACFVLEAIDIATGETHPYTDLEQRCVAPGAFGEIGKRTPVPVADDRLSHTVCQVPPLGFEARWCEINRAECEVAKTEVGCENFGYMCNGEPRPSSGLDVDGSELPPAAGSDSQPAAAGAVASMPLSHAPRVSRADRDSGCSIRAARTATGSGWVLLTIPAAIALCLVRRRRFYS